MKYSKPFEDPIPGIADGTSTPEPLSIADTEHATSEKESEKSKAAPVYSSRKATVLEAHSHLLVLLS